MWISRRVVLLVTGFFLFFSSYYVYACFLGTIDGLPPLSEEYWPKDLVDIPPEQVAAQNDEDRKLAMAFGPESEELKRNIKLELPVRNLVLSAEEFNVE